MPYNPNRSPDWNYGGKNWKLSRSQIDLFLECPKCFYLSNKLGTKRPPGYPFNINSAVDHLLKQEFDVHRVKGTQHPFQKEYGLKGVVPAKHEKIDQWRENFVGVQHLHEPTGLLISGAIDDLWQNKKGEYIVVDYKATAKDEPVTAIDQDWHIGYKRQMEVYQWLLRQNKLKVSDTGYFIYCTGRRDAQAFDKKIEFNVNLIPYTGNDDWVESTLLEIKKTLNKRKIPKANETCEYCAYRDAVAEHEAK
ncbi:MAG: PD-(D/E)XK nuclease family protein [Patescibacteria group bacterium]